MFLEKFVVLANAHGATGPEQEQISEQLLKQADRLFDIAASLEAAAVEFLHNARMEQGRDDAEAIRKCLHEIAIFPLLDLGRWVQEVQEVLG